MEQLSTAELELLKIANISLKEQRLEWYRTSKWKQSQDKMRKLEKVGVLVCIERVKVKGTKHRGFLYIYN